MEREVKAESYVHPSQMACLIERSFKDVWFSMSVANFRLRSCVFNAFKWLNYLKMYNILFFFVEILDMQITIIITVIKIKLWTLNT